LARPPLTTINIPRELGRLAFEALARMDGSKRQRGTERVVDTSLMIRKSSAPPRKHKLRLPAA
jgi:DNA-binding LacI/PurR family transcriptional regulator